MTRDGDEQDPISPGRSAGEATDSAFGCWRERGEGWSPLFSEPLLELALGHLEPVLGAGRTMLDLGSGPGHIAATLQARGAIAIALDVHRPVLAAGRARHAGPARVTADQARLPFRSGSMDGVFSFSSFQYSDRAAVLAECVRVLRPGGRIAVVENLAGNPFAVAGRWLRAISGTSYPEHLEPREHLRWRGRGIYARHFRDVRCDAFHLLTPMLLASRGMAVAPLPGEGPGGALYRLLRRCDRALLRVAPSLAWCVVIRGVR